MSMRPSEACFGLSTSRASRMRPAQVPMMGLPAAWNFSRAGTKPHSSRSLRRVVLSPPGMMRPSTWSSWRGSLTSTDSSPSRSRTLPWRPKSPWRASTPIAMPLLPRRALPAARLEQVRLLELGRLDTGHGIAEVLGDLGQNIGVLEVRRRLDHCLGPRRRIGRLENAGAHEDGLGAELHHERGIGWRGNAPRGEIRHGQLAVLGDPAQELIGRAQVLGLGHQLLRAQRLEPPDAGDHGAHVADRLHDIAGARLALGAD